MATVTSNNAWVAPYQKLYARTSRMGAAAGAGRTVTDPGRKPGDPGLASGVSSARPSANYILKPSADAILEQLLPLYVRNQLYRALVETAAAFLGAQRTAMKNATDNAGEIIELLQRTYNRARQAQITQELAEIVGGAEALKG